MVDAVQASKRQKTGPTDTDSGRRELVARVLAACDRDRDGQLDLAEYSRLRDELHEYSGGGEESLLLRTFSAADTDAGGSTISLAGLESTLVGVPAAVLRWWLELAEHSKIELVPTSDTMVAEGGCDVNWVRLHFRRVPCFCTVSSSSSQV